MDNWICLLCLLLYLSFSNVNGKICNKREMSERLVLRSVPYTYFDSYKPMCFGDPDECHSVRGPVKKSVKWIQVREPVERNVTFCCEGYVRNDSFTNSTDDKITCVPICVPACIKGVCTEPGHCTCDPDHFPDENNLNHCLPFCITDCPYGKCVAPNTCECDFGYSSTKGTCEPICTEQCVNAKCVAPETCECRLGYRQSTNNICRPYCLRGCEHGTCVAPETCACDPEWDMKNGKCVPKCTQACGNGTCVEPNICECFPGYKINLGAGLNESICAPSCENCHGTCMAPNKCLCDAPYVTKYVAAGGGDCDCIENCTDAFRKCEKTVCLKPAVTTHEMDKLLSNATFGTSVRLLANRNITTTNANINTIDVTTLAPTNLNHSTLAINSTVVEGSIGSGIRWIIGTVICLLILILLIIIYVKRRWISSFITKGDYIVEDKEIRSSTLATLTEGRKKEESYYDVVT